MSDETDHGGIVRSGLMAIADDNTVNNTHTSTMSSSNDSDSTNNSLSSASFTSTSANFFNRLRAPSMSDLARKRKIHSNPPPPVGRKSSIQNFRKFDPKTVRPSGEELAESAGNLFCKACRETLAVKCSVVQNHISSKKHADSKERLKTKNASEEDIAKALHAHDADSHRKGETLPDEHSIYRAKVVMAFMKSGIPIFKLDCQDLRSLLEDHGYRHPRHLLDMVQRERSHIRSEVQVNVYQ